MLRQQSVPVEHPVCIFAVVCCYLCLCLSMVT